MYPNGTFARSNVMVEGCIVVEEPEVDEVVKLDDQTDAIKMAESKFLSNIVDIKNRKIAAKYRRTAPITKGSLYSGISA